MTTTANLATLVPPSDIRVVLQVAYQGEPLRKLQLGEIETRTDTGAPAAWAEDGDAIRLWPIPDGAYALRLFGLAELGLPADDAENSWTTTAAALILATAKKLLCRDTLRDPDGAALAKGAEDEELLRLRRETRRRGRQLLASDVPPARAGFDMLKG